MQLSWELRTGRGRWTTSSEVRFGLLEVLECLWPRGASEPEYTEVRAKVGCVQSGPGVGVGAQADPLTCVLSQILSFPSSLGSQASARPCAHLRLTQTLRRVPKVTHPTLGLRTLGYFPRGVLTPPLLPQPPLVPPLSPPPACAPSRACLPSGDR